MSVHQSNLNSLDWSKIIGVLGSNVQLASTPHAEITYPHGDRSYSLKPKLERDYSAIINEVGLYAHIPFCNYLCTFCFYAKQLPKKQDDFRRYVDALKKELGGINPGTRLTQLYIGGGTPSVLPPVLLDELLTSIFERMQPRGQDVHTMECSPESITLEHVKVLKEHGIERVSMGVQTLEKKVLNTLNRHYEFEKVLDACNLIISAGLMLNVDLIYGLPGQTQESFAQDFEILSSQGVHSITAYSLRFNDKTPIIRTIEEKECLSPQTLMKWRSFVKKTAKKLGFEQTRWHTFKRVNPLTAVDVASRFVDVTSQGDQFSIGVSARSRLNNRIYRNHTNFDSYCQRIENGESPVEETMYLGQIDRKIRFLNLSLGDGKSLSRQDYLHHFDSSFDEDFSKPLHQMQSLHFIYSDGDKLALTERGKLLYDLVLRTFSSNQTPSSLRFYDELNRDKHLVGV
jgi:oxygen-independent coproporphyrinogen III oxidase